MSETTLNYTQLRAIDADKDKAYRTEDGRIVIPGPDGCWVDSNGGHLSSVMTVTVDIAPGVEDENVRTLREARQMIDQLSATNARQLAQITNLQGVIQESETKIEAIRDGLIREAKERNWCSEVNDFLRSVDLEPWTTTYRVSFSGYVEVEVDCQDTDRAETMAWDLLNEAGRSYSLSSHLSVDEVVEDE